ncbi:MAG: protein kinase [Gammaproteobacteria bacterium]|nr:protein kinase [Gammaproteobacteria bacterium]
MPLSILIIDDHLEYRELLAHHITSKWPDAVVIQHDPMERGGFDRTFKGKGLDVVLLDYNLGPGFDKTSENGLAWLRDFRSRPGFPPVIFLTGEGDELLAVQAIKAGAADYIPKSKMTNKFLIAAIKEAVRSRRRAMALAKSTGGDPALFGSVPIQIRGYEVIREISNRGWSWVYLAHSEKLNKDVVLKVLRQVGDSSDGSSALERFIQEYEVISKIEHENVVRIYGHGIADDHAYIAMEYFSEGNLKQRLGGRAISESEALAITLQIARALMTIHDVGVLHRDLKPANVMLRADDSVALIDFGLAKELSLHEALTDTGEVFGTPYYMSPEQGKGERVGERGDLYSLGVMFFEMLTGRKPFVAATPLAVIYKHSHAPVPQLPESLSRFQGVIDRLLAKDVNERYQSASVLIDELAAIIPKDGAKSDENEPEVTETSIKR